jgi:hypothetical protein
MSDERVCVVKLTDDHSVERKVEVRAESVYEAALLRLKRLERVGWESDGSTGSGYSRTVSMGCMEMTGWSSFQPWSASWTQAAFGI